jgi:hypothetical protein
MAELEFVKIKALKAREIYQPLELGDEAAELQSAELTPAAYLEKLQAAELYPDAVRFLAFALPKREATWWACLAARHTLADNAPPSQLAAIEAAEAWVYRPTEENRQATQVAAEKATMKTAAGWAATAAFWSGGSISPVAEFAVAPAEDLSGKAAAGAIMLAAAAGEPSKIQDNYQLFLKQGINIACGGDGRKIE